MAEALSGFLYHSGFLTMGLIARRLLARGGHPRILCYHRVADDQWPGTLERKRFVAHLTYLRRHYRFVGLPALVSMLENRRLERDVIALTFDDGHRDALDVLDDLSRAGAPATFFVLTEELPESGTLLGDRLVGTKHEGAFRRYAGLSECERDEIARDLRRPEEIPRLLSTNELRSLISGGGEVGSHSRTHADLSRADPSAQETEIVGSRRDLERETSIPPRYFAYPWGASDASARAIVRAAGYQAAFSTGDRAVRPDSDQFSIPRIHISGNASVARLALEASGLMEILRRIA